MKIYMDMIEFLPVNTLICHEQIDEKRLDMLVERLQRTKILHKPVVVDRKTRVILDGHHRVRAFIQLGIEKIPCLLVNYLDKDIEVTFRRMELKQIVMKEIILKKAMDGIVFPQKTTKHRLPYRPVIHVPIKIQGQ